MPTPEEVMRGDLPLRYRYKLDVPALEARLGAPLGATLRALTEHAIHEAPFAPQTAFEELELIFTYLLDPTPELTPAHTMDLIPLFETGVDSHWFGVPVEGNQPLSDRPVFAVLEQDYEVAPNLESFLGKVAYAGAESLLYDDDPEQLRDTRETNLGNQTFAALSRALCKIPGVKLPKGTASTRTVRAAVDPNEPKVVGLPRVEQLARAGQTAAARRELVKQIGICLDLGDLAAPDKWPDIQILVDSLRPPLDAQQREGLEARGVRVRLRENT